MRASGILNYAYALLKSITPRLNKSKTHRRRQAFPVNTQSAPQALRQSFTLKELPFDIFVEIIEFLEWQDVLLLQQTCHHLARVFTDRAIWLHLYSRYKSLLEPRQHWPDRPLEFYDSAELKTFVLSPFRADHAWKTDHLAPSSRRTVTLEKGFTRSAELIRGGRWFLWGTSRGEIQYYDLEATDLCPRVLIPSPYGDTTEVMVPSMAVDMKDEATYLTFNVAIAVHWMLAECRGPSFDKRKTPLEKLFGGERPCQVWRVTAVPDQRGRVIDLKAEMLVSLSEDLCGSVMKALCLRDSHLAYSIDGTKFTTVINWAQAGRTASSRTRRVIPVISNRVALYPDGWILCAGSYPRHTSDLYQLCEIPETVIQGPATQCHIPSVTPKVELAAFALEISAPFTLRDSIRFVYSLGQGDIGGVVIPRCDPSKSRLVELHSSPLKRPSFGYDTSIDLYGSTDVSAVHYRWPDVDGESFVSPKQVELSDRVRKSIMDKVSARVILLHSNHTCMDVLFF